MYIVHAYDKTIFILLILFNITNINICNVSTDNLLVRSDWALKDRHRYNALMLEYLFIKLLQIQIASLTYSNCLKQWDAELLDKCNSLPRSTEQ